MRHGLALVLQAQIWMRKMRIKKLKKPDMYSASQHGGEEGDTEGFRVQGQPDYTSFHFCNCDEIPWPK